MIKPLLIQFDLHHRLYNNVIEHFTDEESNKRLNGDSNVNHVKYLAGHLLNSNYGLAIMAGLDIQVKWNELFAVMGASSAKDDYPYPDIEEIKAEWNQLHPQLKAALSEFTAEDLSKVPPAPFDQIAESNVNLWAFINHHQAYHIGQIGILRRGFGKEPMSYE